LARYRNYVKDYLRDVIVILERLRNWREMQTLEASYFDNVVFKTPLLSLERYHLIDVLQKARDGVCLGAVCIWDVPENIGSRKIIPLDS
jgi:hypothetical protein